MITKTIKFRGMKQRLTFLTEGDTITENCFHAWIMYQEKEPIPYNKLVHHAIDNFKNYRWAKTCCVGENVNAHPERVYFKL